MPLVDFGALDALALAELVQRREVTAATGRDMNTDAFRCKMRGITCKSAALL